MADTQFTDFPQVVRESACAMLNDPGSISEPIVSEALERGNRGKDISVRDAREMIKDYLTVLCESR